MAGTDMGMDMGTGSYNMDMVDNLEQEHFQAPRLKSRLRTDLQNNRSLVLQMDLHIGRHTLFRHRILP